MGSFVSGSVVVSVNRPLTIRGADWPVRLIGASNEIALRWGGTECCGGGGGIVKKHSSLLPV